jgi:hypothetical protein
MFTIPSTRIKRLYRTPSVRKNQYLPEKEREIKMELTAQEKLIQFIHSLTTEECELIVSRLYQENTKEEV